MVDEKRLLLAMGIVEWAAAIRHMKALGVDSTREAHELVQMIRAWVGRDDVSPDDMSEALVAASRYATEWIRELDELLNIKRVVDE